MSHPRSALLAGAALAVLTFAAPAQAAPYGCDASAVRGSVLGAPAVEPVTANRGPVPCQAATGGGTLPSPLRAGALTASTALLGPADRQDQQQALAAGGVADLALGSLPSLGLTLPGLDAAKQQVEALPVLTLVPAVPPLVPAVTVDVRPAARALLDQLDGLPSADVLRVQGAMAYASAQCANGVATPAGSSQVAGLTVLGQVLPTNAATTETVELVKTQSIDLGRLAADDGLFATLGVPAVLRDALKAELAKLPVISIPAAAASVVVTPAQQERTGGRLVQRALRVEVTALGRPVVDVVLGEAAVTAGAIDCRAPQAPQAEVLGASEAALECTTRRLVLVDVVREGRRVRLFGAADRALAGRTVDIRLAATDRRVARARVQADGSFTATAPLPSRAIRATNDARYQARIGRERSLNLKLERRMVVTRIRASAGRVRITGRVLPPLARPAAPIVVRRRLSCRRFETVATVRPRRDGSFSVLVRAPAGRAAAVYRLQTTVQRTRTNPKRFPTFTLPRAVDLL